MNQGALGLPDGAVHQWDGLVFTAGALGGPGAAGSWSRVIKTKDMCFIFATYVFAATVASGEFQWGTLPYLPNAGAIAGGTTPGRNRIYLGTGTFYNTSSQTPVGVYYRPSDGKVVMYNMTNTGPEGTYVASPTAGCVQHFNLAYPI